MFRKSLIAYRKSFVTFLVVAVLTLPFLVAFQVAVSGIDEQAQVKGRIGFCFCQVLFRRLVIQVRQWDAFLLSTIALCQLSLFLENALQFQVRISSQYL